MKLMISGLPGNMATKVAENVLKTKDLELLPFAFTGPEIQEKSCKVAGKEIKLIKTSDTAEFERIKKSNMPFVIVDFTHPTAINSNVEFYCKQGISFIAGTTGGDRAAIEKCIKESKIVAVVAPNMAKQIVALLEMIKFAAANFPNTFKGYSLEIVESHQQAKADPSGTAVSLIESFNKLGLPFSKEQIKMIRNPAEQKTLGIPECALTGHAWHTYTIKSADGTALFSITHNVNGRDIYMQGTLDAIRFLEKKINAGEKGKQYSMLDVLKG
jgi:4-hydroxy-tetrahydrodipicolinate reductase